MFDFEKKFFWYREKNAEDMEFLRSCARRLDDGEEAEYVLKDVRDRYKTIRCVNVKTCLIRKMCRLNPEFVKAAQGDEEILTGAKNTPPDFPSRYPENVEAFKISRGELRECKRLSLRSALEKNRRVLRVKGETCCVAAEKRSML